MKNFKKAQKEVKELIQYGLEIRVSDYEGLTYTYEGEYFDIVFKVQDYIISIQEINYEENYNTEPITDKQMERLEKKMNIENGIDLDEESIADYQNRLFYA